MLNMSYRCSVLTTTFCVLADACIPGSSVSPNWPAAAVAADEFVDTEGCVLLFSSRSNFLQSSSNNAPVRFR
uniref:Putative secreted protein n=1 Tax=Anopheles darlingi TaxID=43151 RepID=A0A2M4DID5_ANODA